jgi:hypothetical protein
MSEESKEMLEAFFEPQALPATAEFLVHREAIRDRAIERFRHALLEKLQAHRAEPWQAQLIDVAGNPAKNFDSCCRAIAYKTNTVRSVCGESGRPTRPV